MKKLIYIAAFASFAFSSHAKPLKIYLLVGQSNMQGHAAERTLEHLGMDPKTVPLLKAIQNADGSAKVHDQVWISSIDTSEESGVKEGKLTVGYGAGGREPKIGPELTFGITMQKHVGEPILIIKTSWGGKSLNTDFVRPAPGRINLTRDKSRTSKNVAKTSPRNAGNGPSAPACITG